MGCSKNEEKPEKRRRRDSTRNKEITRTTSTKVETSVNENTTPNRRKKGPRRKKAQTDGTKRPSVGKNLTVDHLLSLTGSCRQHQFSISSTDENISAYVSSIPRHFVLILYHNKPVFLISSIKEEIGLGVLPQRKRALADRSSQLPPLIAGRKWISLDSLTLSIRMRRALRPSIMIAMLGLSRSVPSSSRRSRKPG